MMVALDADARSDARHRSLDLPVATVLGLLALAVVLAPLFFVLVPPLTDYANHLARMDIIAHLGQEPLLQRFYAIDWQVIPNLAMDLVTPPMVKVVGVFAAGKLFIAAIIVSIVTGTWALHRALHRAEHGPGGANALLAMAFMYNGIFLLGFTNFLFGIGLALWGTAIRLSLRRRSHLQRLAASTATVLVLFVCHLFAVGLYGMAIFCLEAPGLLRRPWRQALRHLGLMGLPFLAILPLLAASPTMGLADQVVWSWVGKGEGLRFLVTTFHENWEVPLGLAGLAVVAALLATRRMHLHTAGWMLLATGAVTYVAMPTILFGSAYADERLPVALLFLGLGFVRFEFRSRLGRMTALAAILAIIVARSVVMIGDWLPLSQVYKDMRASMAAVEPGSTILVAEATVPTGDVNFNAAFSHAPCLAIIDRQSLVSTAFSVAGKQILTVKPAYTERVDREDGDPPSTGEMVKAVTNPLPPGTYFWQDWQRDYDYVIVLNTEHGHRELTGLADLVHEGKGFQLYRVLHDAMPAPTP
ncbi:hypothetical protein UAJ10_13370 [Nitrospirillum sp. BR 11164]|uniref:hypothetical protein n=1 Tax=Nitrospirillum sp. BR 11164 TaxID=3104324 RepID=UPI002AFE54F3|nr:hypothetical protein [Nitrospirillum sp. BR 11164]MEA1649995.1 hypothetical protein [Nitrospirillum sp. BR 11164]